MWELRAKEAKVSNISATSFYLNERDHNCTSLLARYLIPRGLQTGDLQKSLHRTLCSSEPSQRSWGSFYSCGHSAMVSSPSQTWGVGSLETGHRPTSSPLTTVPTTPGSSSHPQPPAANVDPARAKGT